jgi:hypothetical protein
MSETDSRLQIRVYAIDGSTQIIVQTDPDLIQQTLTNLHPTAICAQNRTTIMDEGVAVSLVIPLITRIDLVTKHLSVWDFPFVLGAPVEITEAEFRDGLSNLHRWEPSGSSGAKPVFLELRMIDGQCVYLWIEVVAGVSAAHLTRIHSLLKERLLVFGLRTGGIGLLNLSNIAHFSVHPETDNTGASVSAHDTIRNLSFPGTERADDSPTDFKQGNLM